ncbi:uncharacterized protein VTP21DRAFT_5679 [Calcarisporiella thermophila]|uniref:uncharacterized protein n=1 Tax=Calcarisporiella thermophila TaxID=911321 RepID=UPI003742955F
MSNQAILRIQKELAEAGKNPDHSIYLHYDEDDMRNVKALITGPPDTPYAFGMFEFTMRFPDSYPSQPPKVAALTTNYGRTRFNPNIYANGKVCLSILGTWPGEAGEQWRPAHGISSVLLSIQSLMSDKPYLNEPGCDKEDNTQVIEGYNHKIIHETIRISICDRLENFLGLKSGNDFPQLPNGTDYKSAIEFTTQSSSPISSIANNTNSTNSASSDTSTPINSAGASHPAAPSSTAKPALPGFNPGFFQDEFSSRFASSSTQGHEFEDLSKRLFMCYYENVIDIIKREGSHTKEGEQFELTKFESRSNGMEGVYRYPNLAQRMAAIRDAINRETDQWIQQSRRWIEKDTTTASNLKRQFEQVKNYLDASSGNIQVELEDKNPFVWMILIFGKPMTNYDGGIFKAKIVFHDKFPEIQPRVRFITPIFHPNITEEGIPFYRASRQDDVRSLVLALNALLEDEPNTNPVTHVNKRAAKLYFGSKEDRREYNRNARRCAGRSLEY